MRHRRSFAFFTGLTIALMAAFAWTTSTPASAIAITTITVASGAGVTPPANGTVIDPNVQVSLNGGATWTQAYAADNTGLWPTPLPGSHWDTPSANRGQGYGNPLNVHYRISFTIPSGSTLQSLTGQMAADDQPVAVILNGTTIASYPYQGNVYNPTPVAFATSNASLFLPGTNVLEFVALNLGGATAVDFRADVSYAAPAPPDPAITGTPGSFSATEGNSFTGNVAGFTDPDPAGTAGEYSATIDWGDGSPTSAGVIAGPTGGPFTVSGTHTYADEGTYTATVTITDTDTPSNTTTASSTGNVADAALTAGPRDTITPTEGTAFGPVVIGSWTDANPGATQSDFTATIDWGDGSPPSTGAFGTASGAFLLYGSHTYADEGTYAITGLVTDDGGSTVTLTATAKVKDAPLSAGPSTSISGTEGTPFSGDVGSFSDGNSGATAADFTATIDWGDGSPTSVGTVSGTGSGPYTVSGSHSYDEGSFAIKVTVTDDGGSTVTLSASSAISDEPLTAGPATAISTTEGIAFSGVVGSFTDGNSAATTADFTATIDWGDGSPTSAGTVAGAGSGPYTVSGSHTYADEGSYAFTVTVTDDGGSTATLTGTASVRDASLEPGTFQTITPNEGVTFSGSVGSFADENPMATAADFTAIINWGDGSPTSVGTVTGTGTGPYAVSGSHTYAEEGNYSLVAVVTDDGGNTVRLVAFVRVGDAPLTAGPPQTITPTEAAGFSGAVGTFKDGNPGAPVSDFTATIDWGDGSPVSAGTVSGPVGGPFTVSGSHTYADEGTFSISVGVVDEGGSTVTLTGTAKVADAPLTAGPSTTISSTEGSAFSGAVGTFTDANPTATTADFTATINWGDGSPSTPGTITGTGSGPYTVSGSHTYADEGSYTLTVTVKDDGGSTATLTGTATITDAALTAGPSQTIASTEGAPFSGAVGTFTDGNPTATTADFTATINWGDGSPTSAGTVAGAGSGPYTVSGSHTYKEEGTYTVTVSVVDDGGSTVTLTATANVADAALAATGNPSLLSTNPVTNVTVATFTDANSYATTADFTATINWGDASPTSTGTITGTGSGPYTVKGSHTYASTGAYTITTTIVDDGGSTATAVSHIIVYAMGTGGGSFVVGNKTATGQVEFWGAQWAKDNGLTGGDAPSAFKGFVPGTAPACGTGWTSNPGNSSNPPATIPSYMAVIVSSAVTKSGPDISGDTIKIVIVKTDPGYAGNPGHAGTGQVVATICG